MSLDTLRHNVKLRLAEKVDGCIQIMMNQQFRPATVTDAAMLPAQTLEEIAVKTLECNAMTRAYQYALATLDEEYKKIVDPKPKEAEPATEDDNESPY